MPSPGQQVWDRALGTPGDSPDHRLQRAAPPESRERRSSTATRASSTSMRMTGGNINKHLVFALDADTGATRPRLARRRRCHRPLRNASPSTRAPSTSTARWRSWAGRCSFPTAASPATAVSTTAGWSASRRRTRPASPPGRRRARGWLVSGRRPASSSDGTSLYVSTGNTTGLPPTAPLGRQRGRLQAAAVAGARAPTRPTSSYPPAGWRPGRQPTLDLGGTAPVLFDLPGAVTFQATRRCSARISNAYLLDRDNPRRDGPPAPRRPADDVPALHQRACRRSPTPNGSFVVTKGPAYLCETGIGNRPSVRDQGRHRPHHRPYRCPWCRLKSPTLSASRWSA